MPLQLEQQLISEVVNYLSSALPEDKIKVLESYLIIKFSKYKLVERKETHSLYLNDEYISKYINLKKLAGLADTSCSTYTTILNAFSSWCDRDITHLNTEDIRD